MSVGLQTSNMHAPISIMGANVGGGGGYNYYGGNKFHSSRANWDPHNSIHRENSVLCSPNMRLDSAEIILEDQFHNALN